MTLVVCCVIFARHVIADATTPSQSTANAPTQTWRVGMSAAFSGPAQALGLSMRTGIKSYFDHVNRSGGVHGRKLELISIDDAYEPSKTAPNMRRLIDDESVFAVIGNVGTPTAAVAVPIANEKKVPMFGAFTGAGLLRKTPPDRYVINFRASYAEETAAMVTGLTQKLGIRPEEIGFFTQNDAYGNAGWSGGVKALTAIGYPKAEELPHGRYTRNTIDVEDGLSRLLDPRFQIKAVIMVGAYKPCAEFIRLARQNGFDPVFLNVSFVGSASLVNELGDGGERVVITQVVPTPRGDSAAAIEFRQVVAEQQQNFVCFEGFLAAKAFVSALRLAGPSASSETIIDAIETQQPIDLGLGTLHRLSPHEHQFSHTVWPTMIRNQQLVPLRDWQQAQSPGAGQ